MDELADLLNSTDIIKQHHAIIGLRKIISCEDLPIQPFIKAEVIPRIIEFAKFDSYPHLQHEAVWILTNIASGTTDELKIIIENDVVKIFVGLL
jgi:hypothetical protein